MTFKGNYGSLVNCLTRDETGCDIGCWDDTLKDKNMTSRKKVATALPNQQLQHSA